MLRPHFLHASIYVCIYLFLGALGLFLLDFDQLLSPKSIIAHLVLALFFIQSFILTHEFGHNSLFPQRRLNSAFGHLTGFVSLLPFTSWTHLHRLHHKWTGWRDKDPTTEEAFVDRLSLPMQKFVNLCWALSIPFFAIAYKFKIYWNLNKINKHLPKKAQKIKREFAIYLLFYALIGYCFSGFLMILLPSYLIGLMAIEVLLLSQHSHIYMPVSQGQKIAPVKCSEQAKYTRSLVFPRAISHWLLFNFNWHESHHHSPAVPCYYLRQNDKHKNAKPVLKWLLTVKKMPATKFIFSTHPNKKVI